jgi:hypothetical protein
MAANVVISLFGLSFVSTMAGEGSVAVVSIMRKDRFFSSDP